MINAVATGIVRNPSRTENSMGLALSCAQPNKKDTVLLNVRIWLNRSAENKFPDYMTAGKRVSIAGKIELGVYEGKKTTRLVANQNDVYFIPRSNEEESSTKPNEQPTATQAEGEQAEAAASAAENKEPKKAW
jgi:single-stranded DNA-binding protein